MTIMTMLPAEGAIVADESQLRKSRAVLASAEESRKSILMCLPRGSFHDREKYHKKKKKRADGLSSSSSHSRSSLRGSRSSHRISLVDFDLDNIREHERYPGLDDVPLNELWLMKEDLIKYRAEFMHDAMCIIQHEQERREKKNEPLRDDQRHIFLQAFRHCQKLKVGDESDSLDMSLRDALYHNFKRYGWTRVGLVALTIEEVYRDNQERRSRMLQAVKDFQKQNDTNHREDRHELLRVACERISYGPTMFARYLGWSTTKIVYRK